MQWQQYSSFGYTHIKNILHIHIKVYFNYLSLDILQVLLVTLNDTITVILHHQKYAIQYTEGILKILGSLISEIISSSI